MNRLTERSPYTGVAGAIDEVARLSITARLAAYEDTGLEPEEIRGMMTDWIVWKQAEAEGRLVVLPCKVGDTPCKHSIGGLYINPIGEECLFCEIYDNQRNITLGECLGNCESEEAEAALRKEEGHDQR